MADDLFVREDTGKPENRINLALFSLLQQDWFRRWLLKRLELCTDAILYPPRNSRRGLRPDLRVVLGSTTLAWIEVELGKDESQAERYSANFSEPVKKIWGKRNAGGDLSLEEIAVYLAKRTDVLGQARMNVEHLRKSIEAGLGGHSPARGRAEVSDEVWDHELVVRLREKLGDRLTRTTGAVQTGHLRIDTTDTPNNRGFSLRVRSTLPRVGTISIMNRTAGRDEIEVASPAKLREYLPSHRAEVAAYSLLLTELGIDVDSYEVQQRPRLGMQTVLDRIDEFASHANAFAGRPTVDHAIA